MLSPQIQKRRLCKMKDVLINLIVVRYTIASHLLWTLEVYTFFNLSIIPEQNWRRGRSHAPTQSSWRNPFVALFWGVWDTLYLITEEAPPPSPSWGMSEWCWATDSILILRRRKGTGSYGTQLCKVPWITPKPFKMQVLTQQVWGLPFQHTPDSVHAAGVGTPPCPAWVMPDVPGS